MQRSKYTGWYVEARDNCHVSMLGDFTVAKVLTTASLTT